MNFTCILFGIIFIAAGIWLGYFDGYRSISAWKAMSDEERDKVNIVPLCRNVGTVIILSGAIFLANGFMNGKWFIWAMIAWLITAGLDVWHISKSPKYINK